MRMFSFLAALAVSVAFVPLSNADVSAKDAQTADEAKMNAAAKVVQRSLNKWRAGDFDGWLAAYAPDVVVATDSMTLVGKSELRQVYKPVFDAGVKTPKILESGWTGKRVYVVQEEYAPDGSVLGTVYAEYEVKRGRISAVYGSRQG